jgi:hypothetical protein
VTVPTRASLVLRVVQVDQVETPAEPRRVELVEQGIDAHGLVHRIPRREQMARVEDEPEALVADRLEQFGRLPDRRGNRARGAGHQLDQQARRVGRRLEGRPQDRRRALERLGAFAGAPCAGVDHEPRRLDDAARAHRLPAELERLRDELGVGRGDVHEVRRVHEERADPALAPRGAELLRRLEPRPGPRTRVRDEELARLGADGPSGLDGGAQAPGRTEMRPDPHAT